MFRFFNRPLRLCIEFTAGFVGVLIVLGALLVWRLSLSPMSSEFFTPYIETAIVDLIPGTQVSISHSLLTWDNADHSITLHADGIRLAAKADDAPIAEVPSLDIRVSVLGLFIGRLIPAALRVGHPQIWLTRDKDGALLFGGMAPNSHAGGDIKTSLRNIADELTHAHFTRKLEINDAVFSIQDEQTGNNWTVEAPETIFERHLGGGLTGEAKIRATQGKNTALAVMRYTYTTDKKRHHISAGFSGINPVQFAGSGSKASIVDLPLTGEIAFDFDTGFDLAGGAIDVRGDAGTLDYPDFWPTPRAIKSFDAKGRYDRETGSLIVPTVMIDFGGPKLTLGLTGTRPQQQTTTPHDLDFALSVNLVGLPMNDFGKIWPKPIITNARAWIAANLTKGSFQNADATFKGSLTWNDLNNIAVTEGQGKVTASGATVTYLAGMPAVTGVSALANFDLNQMTVVVSNGGIGDLRLQPSTITIADFEKNVQTIDLPIHLMGPISAVLKLIDSPPLGYAKAVGLDPDSVAGKFDGTVDLKFPLLEKLLMKDVDVKANANIAGMASSKLVPGLDMADGNLTFSLDKTSFTLQGDAALNKVPLRVSWQEAFNESATKPLRQVSVTGMVSDQQWTDLGVDALSKSQGPIAVNLQMVQKTKQSTSYSGALDMKASAIQVDELGWKKAAGEAAAATFEAEQPAGKNVDVKMIDAYGPGLKIKGKAVLADGFAPISVTLDSFVAGRTDAALRYTQEPGPTGKSSFTVEGTAFDVSGLSGGKPFEKVDPRPKEYHLKLGKLYTSANGFISNVQGSAVRDPEGWSEISLHGQADGGHQLDIDLTPKPDGHRDFSVSCDDFGKALKGLGFTDTVSEGKLKIRGASTPEKPRVIDGQMFIGHFEVKDLPVLVVLMNATSPFGLVNLFTGVLDFDKLEGRFRWQATQLELKDVRAAGNSVGMTIDGKLDLNSSYSDFHGTMAPFSVFNRILGAIPLLGDVITGGEGQGVFGVNYEIKGPIDKPDVHVNPVSLLTPGFLRNLFFGGSDSSDDEEEPMSAPVPATAKPLPPAKTNINR